MADLALTQISGFNDLPFAALQAGNPAFGFHVGAIALNTQFGMISVEIFPGFYKNGDTVPLPVSGSDGYDYDRSELLYAWGVHTTYNPDTGNPTGPDSLFYAGWKVDQNTGEVFTSEYYRTSDPAYPNIANTTDGVLQVFTIGVRRRGSLVLLTEPIYTDVADADIAVDKPWKTGVLKQLAENSKFAVVSSEVLYMGEFTDGQTVPLPVSEADGHTYAYADIKLLFCWRWTCLGSAFVPPNVGYGQLGPMQASINPATGVVDITVKYIDANAALNTIANHGRIAVFAFCKRDPGSLALATGFVEQLLSSFLRPNKLRADVLTALNNNLRESVQTPEFFGVSSQAHGSTIALPTGADGYAYVRSECQYLWDWEDTTSEAGSHLRVSGWYGKITPTSGAVSLTVLRLQPGGPFVEEHTTGNIRIAALVVASRERDLTHPASPISGTVSSDLTSGGAGTGGVAVDIAVARVQPFAVHVNTGMGRTLDVSEVFATVIPDDVATANWPAGLTGSYIRALTAATSTTVLDIIKVISGTPTTVGTATFAAAGTAATLAMASALSLVGGNEFRLRGPATPDPTLAGVYGVFSGTRT